MKILITGATGFVGRHLVRQLHEQGHELHLGLRHPLTAQDELAALGTPFVVGELGPEQDWTAALHGVQAVVHLAAMVHSMNATDPALAPHYHRCNVDGTLSLARQAVTAGVSRFVFLSSVKAVGESSPYGQPLQETVTPHPCDPYGLSKYAAEQGLLAMAAADGMHVSCLRPPLVYGPGVTANFLRLMCWVQRGRLLPLGGINNQRSLLYVGNLVAAIETALDKGPTGSFFVADDEPLSTSGIIEAIARALNKPARLFYFPAWIMFLLAKCLGKQAAVDRLLGSLALDSSQFRQATGWQPVYSVEQGMAQTAQWFLARKTTADKA